MAHTGSYRFFYPMPKIQLSPPPGMESPIREYDYRIWRLAMILQCRLNIQTWISLDPSYLDMDSDTSERACSQL